MKIHVCQKSWCLECVDTNLPECVWERKTMSTSIENKYNEPCEKSAKDGPKKYNKDWNGSIIIIIIWIISLSLYIYIYIYIYIFFFSLSLYIYIYI